MQIQRRVARALSPLVCLMSALTLSGAFAGCDTTRTAEPAATAASPPAIPKPIPPPSKEALIARAKPLELATPYEPPPGDPLEHNTSGYAKTMCSAVFITGLDPDVAAESVGYFTGPYSERKKVSKPVVDRDRQQIEITLPNGVAVVARRFQSQGCISLPRGSDDLFFKPTTVTPHLPEAATTPWPMGDRLPDGPPPGIDQQKLQRAIDAAFDPADSLTSAFVVTHKGRLIGERYMTGITPTTPLESWSMGKSVTATMMGVLIRQGVYKLDQPAPVPEWQSPDDARRHIRVQDVLRMSSGIRIKSPDDPDFDPNGTYPDHLYL
jgi:beta-lactamase family protein